MSELSTSVIQAKDSSVVPLLSGDQAGGAAHTTEATTEAAQPADKGVNLREQLATQHGITPEAVDAIIMAGLETEPTGESLFTPDIMQKMFNETTGALADMDQEQMLQALDNRQLRATILTTIGLLENSVRGREISSKVAGALGERIMGTLGAEKALRLMDALQAQREDLSQVNWNAVVGDKELKYAAGKPDPASSLSPAPTQPIGE